MAAGRTEAIDVLTRRLLDYATGERRRVSKVNFGLLAREALTNKL